MVRHGPDFYEIFSVVNKGLWKAIHSLSMCSSIHHNVEKKNTRQLR